MSDDKQRLKQRLCFALALRNGKDPILKERLLGLTSSEGNHGEDVEEYCFYLESTLVRPPVARATVLTTTMTTARSAVH